MNTTQAPTATDLADHCVMCGLCLAHCPSYQLHRDEGNSPRGRIALIRAWSNGQLDENHPALHSQLDHCVQCHACAAMCPSHVDYAALLQHWQQRSTANKPDRYLRLLLRLAHHSGLQNLLTRRPLRHGLHLLARLPLPGRWRRLAGMLHRHPQSAHRRRIPPASQADTPVQVWIWPGCYNAALDPDLLPDLERLLDAMKLRHGRLSAHCCGALDAHFDPTTQANTKHPRWPKEGTVLALNSGCLHHIQTQPQHPMNRTTDLLTWLAEQDWAGLNLQPPAQRNIAWHTPCTRHGTTGGADLLARLQTELGLTIRTLPRFGHCCGAAGTMFLSQPEESDALLNHCIKTLDDAPPDLLLSDHPACLAQLQRGCHARGWPSRVLHPVSWLVACMNPSS